MLLQAYISQLKLEGFALVSDMVYVTQVCIIVCVMYLCMYYTSVLCVGEVTKYRLETKHEDLRGF